MWIRELTLKTWTSGPRLLTLLTLQIQAVVSRNKDFNVSYLSIYLFHPIHTNTSYTGLACCNTLIWEGCTGPSIWGESSKFLSVLRISLSCRISVYMLTIRICCSIFPYICDSFNFELLPTRYFRFLTRGGHWRRWPCVSLNRPQDVHQGFSLVPKLALTSSVLLLSLNKSCFL